MRAARREGRTLDAQQIGDIATTMDAPPASAAMPIILITFADID
jgi:hypothetical protein